MNVYKTKEFAKFARKADLGSAALLKAAKAVARGQGDADLGGGVFKQRIAREWRRQVRRLSDDHPIQGRWTQLLRPRLCQEREGEYHA